MRTICAWCKVVLSDGCGPVSHDMCAACYEKEMGKIQERPRQGLADAVAGALSRAMGFLPLPIILLIPTGLLPW